MFAACSSDELVQEQGQPQWDADGNGYMAFSVAMPQDAPGTRANDQFADGLAAEYEVKNMLLLLFQGTDEASAKLIQSYDVADIAPDNVTDGNITSDKLIVQKIKEIQGTGNIYAFVVINKNDIFNVVANHLTIEGNPVADGTTFSTIQAMITSTKTNAEEFHGTGKGFLMMNAPLWNTPGGATATAPGAMSTDMQILSRVDASKIKTKKTDAESDPASFIYVERAVAKVTLQDGTGTTKDEHGVDAFTWTVNDWALNNTNSQSYIVRNMEGFDAQRNLTSKKFAGATPPANYRFVGHTSTAHTGSSKGYADATNHYRTYFAKDPNYNADGTFNRTNTPTMSSLRGDANPLYCAENVFDVEHQVWGQTTRAIVGVTLTPSTGRTFYAYSVGDAEFLTEDYVKTAAYNKVLAALKADPNFSAHVTGTANFGSSSISISGSADKVTVKLAGFTFDSSPEGTALKALYDLSSTTGVDVTSSELGLVYYAGGKAYYQARIKHFGDDLTPWNDWETGTKPAPGIWSKIYPDNSSNRDGDYLGRYGVLRNNWYDLKVKNVKKLGYLSPADLENDITTNHPNTPDDELENWIAIDVNILSWAKRTQDVNF